MSRLIADLKYSLRMLLASPVPTLTAVLSLALAIGANTAVFSVVDAVLLEPLPYEDPDQLVVVYERDFANQEVKVSGLPPGLLAMSPPNYHDYRREIRSFEDLTGFSEGPAAVLVSGQEPNMFWSTGVMFSFFELLRVEPVLGRTFRDEEQYEGKNKVVILSDTLWRQLYGADPGVIGKTLRFDGEEHEIVGVMPPGFDYPNKTLIWHPAAFTGGKAPRNFNFVRAFTRLKAGVTLAEAREETAAMARRLAETYPETNRNRGIELVRMQDNEVGDVRTPLYVLWGAVGFVLLIACSNVANLLLAQSTRRRTEVAIRAALGAGRRSLARQLLVESLLLGLAGGALGLLLAYWSLRTVQTLAADQIARLEGAALDGQVLLFTLALSLAAGLLFGLAPAFRLARADLGQVLKGEDVLARAGRGGGGARWALVVLQVSVAVTLVIGAGLLLKSFLRLTSIPPGFRPDDVLTGEVTLPVPEYPDQASTVRFFREFVRRAEELPGVEAAGTTFFLPMGKQSARVGFNVVGRAPAAGEERQQAILQAVTPRFFEAVGIPLVKGRVFTDGDDDKAPQVVIVDQAAADRFFPGEDPIGKRLLFECDFGPSGTVALVEREIVGIVGAVRFHGLDQPADPQLYVPNYQGRWRWAAVAVRAAGDPTGLVAPLRKQVAAIDPKLPIGKIGSLEKLLANTVAKPRFYAWLMSVFSAVALVLAVIGIYGVVSYTIGRRTRELAIRMALGAEGGSILRLVLREAALLGLAGLALGLAAALALTRLLESFLYDVRPLDAATFLVVGLAIGLMVVLAAFLPSRRVSRLAPSTALKHD